MSRWFSILRTMRTLTLLFVFVAALTEKNCMNVIAFQSQAPLSSFHAHFTSVNDHNRLMPMAPPSAINLTPNRQRLKTSQPTPTTLFYKTLPDDPFEVLNLPRGAPGFDKKTIKQAYKKLAVKYHPDRVVNQDSTPEEKKKASDDFARINAAYTTLMGKDVEDDVVVNKNKRGYYKQPHRRSHQHGYGGGGGDWWRNNAAPKGGPHASTQRRNHGYQGSSSASSSSDWWQKNRQQQPPSPNSTAKSHNPGDFSVNEANSNKNNGNKDAQKQTTKSADVSSSHQQNQQHGNTDRHSKKPHDGHTGAVSTRKNKDDWYTHQVKREQQHYQKQKASGSTDASKTRATSGGKSKNDWYTHQVKQEQQNYEKQNPSGSADGPTTTHSGGDWWKKNYDVAGGERSTRSKKQHNPAKPGYTNTVSSKTYATKSSNKRNVSTASRTSTANTSWKSSSKSKNYNVSPNKQSSPSATDGRSSSKRGNNKRVHSTKSNNSWNGNTGKSSEKKKPQPASKDTEQHSTTINSSNWWRGNTPETTNHRKRDQQPTPKSAHTTGGSSPSGNWGTTNVSESRQKRQQTSKKRINNEVRTTPTRRNVSSSTTKKQNIKSTSTSNGPSENRFGSTTAGGAYAKSNAKDQGTTIERNNKKTETFKALKDRFGSTAVGGAYTNKEESDKESSKKAAAFQALKDRFGSTAVGGAYEKPKQEPSDDLGAYKRSSHQQSLEDKNKKDLASKISIENQSSKGSQTQTNQQQEKRSIDKKEDNLIESPVMEKEEDSTFMSPLQLLNKWKNRDRSAEGNSSKISEKIEKTTNTKEPVVIELNMPTKTEDTPKSRTKTTRPDKPKARSPTKKTKAFSTPTKEENRKKVEDARANLKINSRSPQDSTGRSQLTESYNLKNLLKGKILGKGPTKQNRITGTSQETPRSIMRSTRTDKSEARNPKQEKRTPLISSKEENRKKVEDARTKLKIGNGSSQDSTRRSEITDSSDLKNLLKSKIMGRGPTKLNRSSGTSYDSSFGNGNTDDIDLSDQWHRNAAAKTNTNLHRSNIISNKNSKESQLNNNSFSSTPTNLHRSSSGTHDSSQINKSIAPPPSTHALNDNLVEPGDPEFKRSNESSNSRTENVHSAHPPKQGTQRGVYTKLDRRPVGNDSIESNSEGSAKQALKTVWSNRSRVGSYAKQVGNKGSRLLQNAKNRISITRKRIQDSKYLKTKNDNDVQMQGILKNGSLQEVGEEMDGTELIVEHLSSKASAIEQELSEAKANSKAATARSFEKIQFEERAAELHAQKDVINGYLQEAEHRFVELEARFWELKSEGKYDRQMRGEGSRSTKMRSAIEKNLPLLVFTHFAYRFCQMLFGDPSAGLGARLGRGASIGAVMCLLPHALWSLSSFRDLEFGKSVDRQKFRYQSMIYGGRSLLSVYLAWLSFYRGHFPSARRIAVLGSCATALIADMAASKLQIEKPESNATDMPFWDSCSIKTQERFKSFYSYCQVMATLACITVGNPAWPLSVLIPTQLAPILTTLVHKGMLSSRMYHVGYTSSLVLPFLVGLRSLSTGPQFLGMSALGFAIVKLHQRQVKKYAVWSTVFGARILFGDMLINGAVLY